MNDRDALVEFLGHHDARCPVCRYQLNGLTTNRCPECGAVLRLGVVGDISDPTRLAPLLLVLLPAAAAFTSGVYWLLFIVQAFMLDPTSMGYGAIDFLITFGLLLALIPLVLGLALVRQFLSQPQPQQWRLARVAAGYSIAILTIDLVYNALVF